MKLFPVLLVAIASQCLAGGWFTDYKGAQKKAQQQEKIMLVYFTGSDWSQDCINLQREVFSQFEFTDYASRKWILVLLDFPEIKQLSSSEQQQNSQLASKYQVKKYPTVLLLTPQGDEINRTGYLSGGATNYLEHLQKLIHKEPYVVFPEESAHLQNVIDQARPYDTIILKEGTYIYKEPVKINNKNYLTIKGEENVWIILEDPYQEVIEITNGYRVYLKNIKARHQTVFEHGCWGSVVGVKKSKRIWVYNCELNGCGATGVDVSYSRDVVISNCYLHNNSSAAISLYHTQNLVIHDNVIENNGSAVSGSGDFRMTNNTVKNNKSKWLSSFAEEIMQKDKK